MSCLVGRWARRREENRQLGVISVLRKAYRGQLVPEPWSQTLSGLPYLCLKYTGERVLFLLQAIWGPLTVNWFSVSF